MKKLTDLAPEEKRVMCAESCGKEHGHICPTHGRTNNYTEWPRGGNYLVKRRFKQCTICGSDVSEITPPYDTSLDAMATAEATLESEIKVRYYNLLTEICSRTATPWPSLATVCATATQRLDAFLIAKGLAE